MNVRRKIPAVMLVPVIAALLLTGCPEFTDKDTELIDNVKYCMRKPLIESGSDDKAGVVYSIVWDGDPDHTVFEIKDTYKDVPVTDIGAKVTGFCAEAASDYCYYDSKIYKRNAEGPYEIIDEEVTFKPVVFTLKFGANIDSLCSDKTSAFADDLVFLKDGKYICYQTYYLIECPEENKTFYSEDGKLYKRADDSLVFSFRYAADNVIKAAEE
ncbi:MAG: hypothetical protein J6X33_04730 [Clostridiales bacterium]|nr:hypothetical protein [Clostridiales bacterium]